LGDKIIPPSPFANDGEDLLCVDAIMDVSERRNRDGDGDVLFRFLNIFCQDVLPPRVASSSLEVPLGVKENLEDQAELKLFCLVCSVVIEAIFVCCGGGKEIVPSVMIGIGLHVYNSIFLGNGGSIVRNSCERGGDETLATVANSESAKLPLRLKYEGKGSVSGSIRGEGGLPLHSQPANQRRIVSANHSQLRHIANQLFNPEIPNELQTPSSIGAVSDSCCFTSSKWKYK
jgi:hypothetical protein